MSRAKADKHELDAAPLPRCSSITAPTPRTSKHSPTSCSTRATEWALEPLSGVWLRRGPRLTGWPRRELRLCKGEAAYRQHCRASASLPRQRSVKRAMEPGTPPHKQGVPSARSGVSETERRPEARQANKAPRLVVVAVPLIEYLRRDVTRPYELTLELSACRRVDPRTRLLECG